MKWTASLQPDYLRKAGNEVIGELKKKKYMQLVILSN
jgi:hypothetical protein